MEMQKEQSSQSKSFYTPEFYASLSALQIRLDTKPILEDFENFLRGSKIVVVEENGQIVTKKIVTGKQKANEIGIQSIMSELSMMINSQTVQGNIELDMYNQFIKELHIDFATNVVNNCYNWEIDDDDLDLVIDAFIHHIQLFISRAVDNEERLSYGQSMKVIESNTTQQNRAGWGLFGGNKQ